MHPNHKNIKKILTAIIIVIILALVYIFYVSKTEAPSDKKSAPTSTFQGPPAGIAPFVKGPTEPPPGY